jgi:periplasmic protein TonB
MDFSQRDRNPVRLLTAILTVALLHVLLGYALLNGLAHKAIGKPVDVRIVEVLSIAEAAPVPPAPPPPEPPPPAPPEPPPPPPPKPVKPPPPRPTPKKVVKPAPPRPVPKKAVKPVEPRPKALAAIAPPRPTRAPVARPSAPTSASVGVVCPNHRAVRNRIPYPAMAERQGIGGQVLIELTVGATGGIGNVRVLSSSSPMFTSPVVNAVRRLNCIGQGHPVVVRVPFVFRVDS